jgi:hypothetical protein
MAGHDVTYIRSFARDGFESCEAASRRVFLSFQLSKIALFLAGIEL